MSRRCKCAVLPIDIYNTNVLIEVGDFNEQAVYDSLTMPDEVREGFREELRRNPVHDHDNGGSFNLNGEAHVLWVRHAPDTPDGVAEVAHEAFHTAFNILDFAGVRLSRDSDEAFAYLAGYIAGRVTELSQSGAEPQEAEPLLGCALPVTDKENHEL